MLPSAKNRVSDNNRRGTPPPDDNKDIELKVQLIDRRLTRKRWRHIGNRIAASLREFKSWTATSGDITYRYVV